MLDGSSLSFHRHFLNPFDGSRYTFTLYELFAEKCIGSSGSWLIMKGLDHYIHNPFTLTKITLPKNEPYFYEPIIALSKPASPQFSLIALTGYPRSLHFIRQNEKKWSSYNYNLDVNTDEIIQAVTSNGKFYAMSSRGRLAFIDLDRDTVLEWKVDIARIKFDLRREHVYFLESNKEIVLVIVAYAKLSPIKR
ncbi:uncharacterized protein A4U43_C02F3500 [Asparagus officinalis]|uniref:KIB1-4 beta-propeller domain-containing protein n=1 Tax=Asparagus officinalis TaxID=4686 RepID=A0A5P1FJM7_ASPOF|nr:uncharacterized protein A4U43_C02F3500 [Asparagus officinalis]